MIKMRMRCLDGTCKRSGLFDPKSKDEESWDGFVTCSNILLRIIIDFMLRKMQLLSSKYGIFVG